MCQSASVQESQVNAVALAGAWVALELWQSICYKLIRSSNAYYPAGAYTHHLPRSP